MQGKTSNYDTDVFQPIIKEIGRLCGKTYGEDPKVDIAMRVIADHIRTIAFSITDGQLPSNAKAGYVIRRILRRAVRYGYTFLGQKQAFLYKLLDILIETMGDAYPELKEQKVLIGKVIKEEEDAFLRTLETGIKLLDKVVADAKAAGKNEISGVDAFTLYDTYGFPIDLTELILKEKGMGVDLDGFNAQMQQQKERARNAAAVETSDWVVLREGEPEFVGYDMLECDCRILRYRKVKQKNKEYYQIVLDRTPFYAEMGGQVGDTGKLISANETVEILQTKRENNLGIHITEHMPEEVTAQFHAVVDKEARQATACNHTATHLLHEALREVLGTHVEQKGSYVSPQSLRFDFSHFKKVTDEELRQVEILANRKVREAIPLDERRNVPIAEAKAMGAMALFGEKYGEEVRVIRFGSSVELCGGTHVANTGNIGMIKIVTESSIAAGIRRIEAITGARVEETIYSLQDSLKEIATLFNNAPNLMQAIHKAIDENTELRKQAEEYVKEKMADMKERMLKTAENVNGMKLIRFIGPMPADVVKGIAFMLRNEVAEGLAFVAATKDNDKPLLTVMFSNDVVADGKNASAIVREAAKLIQGGGGGQPYFAQAGGKNAEHLSDALEKMVSLVVG